MSGSLAALLARPDVWRGPASAVPPVPLSQPLSRQGREELLASLSRSGRGIEGEGWPIFPTGFPELDAELPGGGWPRGQLTELLPGAEGIGELSLLLPGLAQLADDSGRGRPVFCIAPPHPPHLPAWQRAGIDPARLRWVDAAEPRDALWAAVQVLRCGAVGACLMWLEGKAPLASNALRRLHLAAAEGGVAAFLFRPAPAAAVASPAPLRLGLEAIPDGRLQVRLLKRRGVPLGRTLRLVPARPPVARRREPDHALAGTAAVRGLPDAALA